MDNKERVDYLYLNDTTASFRPLVRLPSRTAGESSIQTSRTYTNRAASRPIFSSGSGDRSSVGNSSRQSNSESNSRRSSASSAPSIHLAPPWYLDPPRNMTRVEYPYHLPCEFDCHVRFDPENYEDWIRHGASHFVKTGPPQITACIFCDDGNFQSWNERMIHMGNHYHNGTRIENSRPDFFVIKQLYRGDMLNEEEFNHYMDYTERPACENLVEYGYETPEMKERERRERAEPQRRQNYGNDLAAQERQIGRDRGKGRSGRTHRSSGKSKIIYDGESRS